MAKLNIKVGAKLDVTARTGEGEEEYKSSYAGESGGKWRIAVPMANGKSQPLAKGTAVALSWETDGGTSTVNGTVEGSVKQGVRTYLAIRRDGDVQRQERRAHTRIPAEIPVELCGYTTDRSGARVEQCYKGVTTDISNGGVAVVTNAPTAVGEIISLTLARRGVKKLPLKGQVCWVRPAPKGTGYRDFIGLQFLFTNSEEGKELARLTESLAAKI